MKSNEPARKSFNKYGKGRCQHFWDTIFKDVDKAVNGMAVFDTLGWPRSAPPMPKQDIKRLQILSLLAETREEIQTLSTELADQNPELLSDLDFKDILSLSPER